MQCLEIQSTQSMLDPCALQACLQRPPEGSGQDSFGRRRPACTPSAHTGLQQCTVQLPYAALQALGCSALDGQPLLPCRHASSVRMKEAVTALPLGAALQLDMGHVDGAGRGCGLRRSAQAGIRGAGAA